MRKHLIVHRGIATTQLDTLKMRRELEPKRVPQWFLGSLLGTRRSAIGQFFSLSLTTVPEVYAKVNSAHFPSRMADCSNTGEDAMRYITQAPHPSATGTVYLLFQASLGIRSWLDIFR